MITPERVITGVTTPITPAWNRDHAKQCDHRCDHSYHRLITPAWKHDHAKESDHRCDHGRDLWSRFFLLGITLSSTKNLCTLASFLPGSIWTKYCSSFTFKSAKSASHGASHASHFCEYFFLRLVQGLGGRGLFCTRLSPNNLYKPPACHLECGDDPGD